MLHPSMSSEDFNTRWKWKWKIRKTHIENPSKSLRVRKAKKSFCLWLTDVPIQT